MAQNAIVQTRFDPEIRDRASKVLEPLGLTISDAMRILLTRTAEQGALPAELLSGGPAYDAWFRAKVQEALDDPRPGIPDEEVRREFAEKKAALRKKIPDENTMGRRSPD